MLMLTVQTITEHCEWCDGEQEMPKGAQEYVCRHCGQISITDAGMEE